MVRIVEYRVFVPLKISQCNTACYYMVTKRAKEETGSDEGIELLSNEKIEGGKKTHKIFHMKSKIPSAIVWSIPDYLLHMHEESTDKFPYYFTKYYAKDLGDEIYLNTTTMHVEYKNGDEIPENINDLTDEELNIREVVYMDILNGPKSTIDLHDFSCSEAGIEKMIDDSDHSIFVNDSLKPPRWVENYSGPMTLIVKTVKFQFKWYGLQTMVESFAFSYAFPTVFMDNHRMMVKWAPEWCNITPEELSDFEKKTRMANSETLSIVAQ